MRIESMNVPQGTPCNPGFRGLIRVSFGKATPLTADGNDSRPQHYLHFDSASVEALSQLRFAIELACVGVRLLITGPPRDIHAAAAVAAECGLAEEEVTLVSDECELRIVFCAHCRTRTETAKPVGSEVECQGCGTDLEIANHFSRRQAAYLGFAANAEEAA